MKLIFFAIILFNIVYSKPKNQKIIKRKVLKKKKNPRKQKTNEYIKYIIPSSIILILILLFSYLNTNNTKLDEKKQTGPLQPNNFDLISEEDISMIKKDPKVEEYAKKPTGPVFTGDCKPITEEDILMSKILSQKVEEYVKNKYPDLQKEIYFLVKDYDENGGLFKPKTIVFFEKKPQPGDGLCWLHSAQLRNNFVDLSHKELATENMDLPKMLINFFLDPFRNYYKIFPREEQEIFKNLLSYQSFFSNIEKEPLSQDQKEYFYLLKILFKYFFFKKYSHDSDLILKQVNNSPYSQDIQKILREKSYYKQILMLQEFIEKNSSYRPYLKKIHGFDKKLLSKITKIFIKKMPQYIIDNYCWGHVDDIGFLVDKLLNKDSFQFNYFDKNPKLIKNIIKYRESLDYSNNNFESLFHIEKIKKSTLEECTNDKEAIIYIYNGINHYDNLVYKGQFNIEELKDHNSIYFSNYFIIELSFSIAKEIYKVL